MCFHFVFQLQSDASMQPLPKESGIALMNHMNLEVSMLSETKARPFQ